MHYVDTKTGKEYCLICPVNAGYKMPLLKANRDSGYKICIVKNYYAIQLFNHSKVWRGRS